MPMPVDAAKLHRNAIVVDAHSDVLADVTDRRLAGEPAVLQRRHIPDWQTGGVNVVVTTLYVDGPYKPDRALRRAVEILGNALNDLDEAPEITAFCRTRSEVERAVAGGKIAFILAMEGGEPIQDGLGSLRVFHELGVRILGFTWNQRNLLAEGVGEERAAGGLTELGREMVREANRLGVLLDVSHLSVKSFWDMLEESNAPIIASHSNAKALCGHRRNLDDAQLEALAARGGVVGINAVSAFVTDDPAEASLAKLLDHLDYIANLVGVEHVALGPDFVDYLNVWNAEIYRKPTKSFDFADDFGNISRLPALTAGLVERGYDEAQIRGILGLNFLRVFERVCG